MNLSLIVSIITLSIGVGYILNLIFFDKTLKAITIFYSNNVVIRRIVIITLLIPYIIVLFLLLFNLIEIIKFLYIETKSNYYKFILRIQRTWRK